MFKETCLPEPAPAAFRGLEMKGIMPGDAQGRHWLPTQLPLPGKSNSAHACETQSRIFPLAVKTYGVGLARGSCKRCVGQCRYFVDVSSFRFSSTASNQSLFVLSLYLPHLTSARTTASHIRTDNRNPHPHGQHASACCLCCASELCQAILPGSG